jgi:hypothetical protein
MQAHRLIINRLILYLRKKITFSAGHLYDSDQELPHRLSFALSHCFLCCCCVLLPQKWFSVIHPH